ncbi:hypothetical protein Hanom_Chr15g01410691 [Helianthus anomalus]
MYMNDKLIQIHLIFLYKPIGTYIGIIGSEFGKTHHLIYLLVTGKLPEAH